VQYYDLRALGPRTIEGTILADTDAGWFTWDQPAVELTRMTYTAIMPDYKTQFVVAESPELSVRFPKPVTIRRAWVATATARGDAQFGWDARGKVTCDPPDFAPDSSLRSVFTKRTPQAGDPTPAPAPPMASALQASPPFPDTSCAQPFVAATVTDPVRPEFPSIVRDEGFSGRAVSVVYVAIDPHGNLADAWVFASSGYRALDNATLSAARRSKYAAPTSYCRAVSGTYLFKAVFGR
jgi:TonB family protein